MLNVRLGGIIIAAAILLYTFYKYQRGSYRRLDLIIGIISSLAVAVLSISPTAANILTELLGLQNRLFAILVFTNVILFGLFLYVLGKANSAERQVGNLVRALAGEEFRKHHQLAKTGKLIAIVIPAFNEEQTIASVLSRLPHHLDEYEVRPIVVVDGSRDNTAEVVRRENYMVATHAVNRGQGDALRTGFEIALQQGAEIIMTMDADGQHRPEDIEKLVRPVIDGQADYVMGSRILGEYEDQGGVRHVGILLFTILINVLGGVKITDCTNGFRAIRGSELGKLRLSEDRFNAPELIMEAARNNLRIKEVPVTIARRAAGESKKPRKLGYPLGFLRTIVTVWLR